MPVHMRLVVPLVPCLRPAALVVLADHPIPEVLGLLDLAGEDGEEPRLFLVDHGHRVALVLVDDSQQRRDVGGRLERQVVHDADGEKVRAPEVARRARKDRQALAARLLAVKPALHARRFGLEGVTHGGVVEPGARRLDEILERDLVRAPDLGGRIEVEVDAQDPCVPPVERRKLVDLLFGQHRRSIRRPACPAVRKRCPINLWTWGAPKWPPTPPKHSERPGKPVTLLDDPARSPPKWPPTPPQHSERPGKPVTLLDDPARCRRPLSAARRRPARSASRDAPGSLARSG